MSPASRNRERGGAGRGVPWSVVLLACLGLAAACAPERAVRDAGGGARGPVAAGQRLAVIVLTPPDFRWRAAAARIEAMAQRMLAARPDLRLVERTDLAVVLQEHELQARLAMDERTAVSLGRVAGADGLLVFRLEGPSVHELVLARDATELPPVVLSGKLLRVETGEVAWQTAITVPIEGTADWRGGEGLPVRPLRQAVERALERLQAELEAVVR